MNRLAVICAAAASLAISACASDPHPMTSAPAKRMVTPPGGLWEVVEAVAIAPTGTDKSPYLGQKLALYETSAGDPAGRTCAKPVYMGWEAEAASMVGAAAKPGEMRPVMDVTCDGQAFATYMGMADGSLMTRVNNWALTLKRVPPEAMIAKAPEPAPAPEPVKVEPAKAEPAKMVEADKRSIVYLASYKNEQTAKSGWKALAKKSPILAKQEPVITPFDLGKKGTWYRLYGLAVDEAERAAICTQLGKLVDECGSRLRE